MGTGLVSALLLAPPARAESYRDLVAAYQRGDRGAVVRVGERTRKELKAEMLARSGVEVAKMQLILGALSPTNAGIDALNGWRASRLESGRSWKLRIAIRPRPVLG